MFREDRLRTIIGEHKNKIIGILFFLSVIVIIAYVVSIVVFEETPEETSEEIPKIYSYKIPLKIGNNDATHYSIEWSRGTLLEEYNFILIPEDRIIYLEFTSDDDDIEHTVYVWLYQEIGENVYLNLGYEEHKFKVFYRDI